MLFFIIGVTAFDGSRFYLHNEDEPAFTFLAGQPHLIEFQGLRHNLDGIHQFNDAQQLVDVIKMASPRFTKSSVLNWFEGESFESGKRYEFQIVNKNVVAVKSGWMSAAKRMVLGIPLSVDRMSRADWMDLPGVGASLALSIETDRQKNGEFGEFLCLSRVKGVGKKRLERWKEFFVQQKCLKIKDKNN